MSENSGWSEERTDIFGNKYVQHYDEHGEKAGYSQEQTGLFGDKYSQHYDRHGEKAGYSQEQTGLFGNGYTQHHDREGDRVGWSENRTSLFGDTYTDHYDQSGEKTGQSEQRTGLFGDRYAQHYGHCPHARSIATSGKTAYGATSGGGGSGDCDFGAILLGLALVVGLAVGAIVAAVNGCVFVVETYVIKTINPNYVTSAERAEAAKRQKERDQQEAARQSAQQREKAERPWRVKRQMERSLTASGHKFAVSQEVDLVEFDASIWGFGYLDGRVAVALSEDGGKSWTILHRFDHGCFPSWLKVCFIDKANGFLSYCVLMEGSCLYKTEDGGRNWVRVLVTSRIPGGSVIIERIDAEDPQHIAMKTWRLCGGPRIESCNGGASWKCLSDGRSAVETIDGGVTWRTAEERAEYLERQKQLEVERTRRAAEAEAEIKRQAEGRERQKQLEAERTRRLADTEREIKRQAEQRERRKQLEVERKRQAEEDKRRRTDEAKWRDWSASIGRAKFVKAIDGTVYLQGEDGRMMTVKRGRLSPEERLWITYRLWRR